MLIDMLHEENVIVTDRNEEPRPANGAPPEEPVVLVPPLHTQPVDVVALEQRVRRLEDAMASLQDTRPIEERIVDRLVRQRAPAQNSSNLIIEAGRRLLPFTVPSAEQTTAPPQSTHTGPRRHWLLTDIYTEVRAMLCMYVDPRYRLSWVGRIVPLVLVCLIVLDWVWVPGYLAMKEVPGLSIVASLLIKAVDLVLAYFLFKILSREAQRYRETAPDLPASLRP